MRMRYRKDNEEDSEQGQGDSEQVTGTAIVLGGKGVLIIGNNHFAKWHITEKRADHSLRDEQICNSPLSFLCAVAPRFSVDMSIWQNSVCGCNCTNEQ